MTVALSVARFAGFAVISSAYHGFAPLTRGYTPSPASQAVELEQDFQRIVSSPRIK